MGKNGNRSEAHKFVQGLGEVAPITFEEERELIRRAQRGDRRAQGELCRRAMGFVVSLSCSYQLGYVPVEDVIQEGSLGVLRAIQKFDLRTETRFLTYAAWWVRAYITKFLRRDRSNVRGRAADTARHDMSLDAPVEPGAEDGPTHLDLLEDESPSPEEVESDRGVSVRVQAILNRCRRRFSGVERDVIYQRLCQPKQDQATLQEIGDRYGISRERVRQLEKQLQPALRNILAEVA